MPNQRLTPAQIAAAARARGYDPQAVLAVARQEGLGGGIGDGGHAYGPFQLNNAGGVITQQYGGRVNDQSVQNWAWSPEGVSYALDRMGAAKGLHGAAAIKAIVTQFERPANPGREITNAVAAYGSGMPAPMPAAGGSTMTDPALSGPGMPPPGVPSGGVDNRRQLLLALANSVGQKNPDYTPQLTQLLSKRQAPPPASPPVTPGGLVAQPGQPPQTHTLPLARGQVLGNTVGENPRLLASLAALAAYEHAPVQINSGYRSTARQAQLYANRASNPNPVAPPGHSLHEQGLAADGTVGGKPLGTLPAALLARYGLMPVPGDPVHVQVLR